MHKPASVVLILTLAFLKLATAQDSSPTGPDIAKGTDACQCLQVGTWCGSRAGIGAWNGTHPETHHNETRIDGPHYNGTHAHHNGTHHNGTMHGTRNKTLSGMCHFDTSYHCPATFGLANNLGSCSQDSKSGSRQRCIEGPVAGPDVCG
jgi:hypothetical protein